MHSLADAHAKMCKVRIRLALDALSAEDGKYPLGIVCPEEIHNAVEHAFRIPSAYPRDRIGKFSAVSVAHIRYDRVAERIVHHRIKLSGGKIRSAFSVGYLIRRILPDLTDHGTFGIIRSHGAAKSVKKAVGQLVADVKPPARDPRAVPLADYGIRDEAAV